MEAEAKRLKARAKRLLDLYGLTLEDYARILEYQHGECAICKRPPKDGKVLHVDHDHVTGETRGLLNWRCNKALAGFRDDRALFAAAAMYLADPPVAKALGHRVFGRVGRVTNKRRKKK